MRPIEIGWRSYEQQIIPPHAPELQRIETRRAFYAGAATLFGAMMNCLDPGQEATDADLSRMDAIANELRAYRDEVARQALTPEDVKSPEPAGPKQKSTVSIRPWYPTPDGSGEPTQVHVLIEQQDRISVVRFHSAEGVDRFVADLVAVRLEVWGEP